MLSTQMRKKAAGVKKRVRFQLAYSPSMSQMTDTDTLEHFGDFGAWQDHPYSLLDPHEHELAPNSGVVHEAEEQRTDSAKKGDKGSFLLRNKPVVFHHIKDKRFRTVPCDATLLYKLDPKVHVVCMCLLFAYEGTFNLVRMLNLSFSLKQATK